MLSVAVEEERVQLLRRLEVEVAVEVLLRLDLLEQLLVVRGVLRNPIMPIVLLLGGDKVLLEVVVQ